jgi:hypothetical protein
VLEMALPPRVTGMPMTAPRMYYQKIGHDIIVIIMCVKVVNNELNSHLGCCPERMAPMGLLCPDRAEKDRKYP